jgi:hypothetical protein
MIVAFGEVEIAGGVESHAVRQEEVYRGGCFAVARVGELVTAGDRIHHVGLCGGGRQRRGPRKKYASKRLHKLYQMLDGSKQEIKDFNS